MKVRIISAILCMVFIISIIPSAYAESVNGTLPITGDTDGDGIVTILDATTIQRWLAKVGTDSVIGKPAMNPYEPIELNFTPVLESEEVGEGEDYCIYNREELTPDILEHRAEHDTLIVERLFVQVTEIDPTVTYRAYGTVIGYDDTVTYLNMNDIVAEGTIMLTYRIYNPNNNDPKSYVNRYDYVLDRRYEA